ASVFGGAPPYAFVWDFGDGTAAASGAASHTYGAPARFNVALMVTDVGGAAARRVVKSILVAAAPLVADFAFSPDSAIVGASVAFTPSVAGGVSPYTLSWDFGDGSPKSGDRVAHLYGSPGTVAVTLTLRDSGGASTTV